MCRILAVFLRVIRLESTVLTMRIYMIGCIDWCFILASTRKSITNDMSSISNWIWFCNLNHRFKWFQNLHSLLVVHCFRRAYLLLNLQLFNVRWMWSHPINWTHLVTDHTFLYFCIFCQEITIFFTKAISFITLIFFYLIRFLNFWLIQRHNHRRNNFNFCLFFLNLFWRQNVIVNFRCT